MNSSATTPTLSPYRPGTSQGVEQALRAVLGLPETVALRYRDLVPEREQRVWLELEIGPSDAPLRLRLGEASGASEARTPHRLQLQVMASAEGLASLTTPLQRRLAALERAGDPRLDAFFAAVRSHRAAHAVPPGELATIGPQELLLRLTFRCNQDCSFCWQDRTWPSPPLQQFETWLDEAHQQGVPLVVLSGGEPTLSPHLLPLLERARTLGMKTGIQTNAIQLAKPHVRKGLCDAGLGYASVSYHSHDPALSDEMTRAPGTHVRTEKGILAALADGIPVSLNMVLERRNLATLRETAMHLATHLAPAASAATPLTLSISHPNAYFDREQWLETMPPLDEVEGALREAIGILAAAGVQVRADGPCGFPLCTLRAVPSAFALDAAEAIPDANFGARGNATACVGCAVRDACVGPRKTYLERYGERGLVPFATRPSGTSHGRNVGVS